MDDIQREAFDHLKALFLLNDFCIEDYIYNVREREGKGWDGPNVTAFGEWISKAHAIIDHYDGNIK